MLTISNNNVLMSFQGRGHSLMKVNRIVRKSFAKIGEVIHKPHLIDAHLTCSRWSLGFEITNKTLMPRDILNVLGKDIVIELTPKSINSRKLLKGI